MGFQIMSKQSDRRETPDVSVVIPVYNSEPYLGGCLESVLGQSLKNLEVICVDDGSTDRSPQILEEFAARDGRIKVMRKENGGLVSARKAGAVAAAGRYIGYVDSDDWIDPEMYEILFHRAVETNVELVTSGYFMEGNYTTVHLDMLEEGLYEREGLRYLRDNTIYKLDQKETGLRGSLCCKLFSASLLKRVQMEVPDEISIAEDKVCTLLCVLNCESAFVLRRAFYHYRIHPDSMAHMPDSRYLNCVNQVYQSFLRLYRHENFSETMRRQAELYITELLIMGINRRLGFRIQDLLWIDPGWLEGVPRGSRIVLCGGGDLGRKYKRQMESREDLTHVATIEFLKERETSSPDAAHADSPEVLQISEEHYDCIVITVKNPKKAEEIRKRLMDMNVPEDQIFWFEQREIFWKYAEADGLLRSSEA